MLEYGREILYILGDDRWKIPVLILIFLSSALLDVLGLGLIGAYVGLIVSPDVLDGALGELVDVVGFPREQEQILIILGLALVMVFLVKTASAIWINYLINRFSLDQLARLRSFLMQGYQSMSYIEFIRRNSSEYIHMITGVTGQFVGVVGVLLRTISNCIIAFGIICMLAWQNSFALIVLLGLFGVMILSYDLFFRRKVSVYGENNNVAATAMIQAINEGIGGLKELRILGKERSFQKMVRRCAEEASFNALRSQSISSSPRYMLELIMIVFIVLLVIATLFFEGKLEEMVPTLAIFAAAGMRLIPAANVLSSGLIDLRYGRDAVSRLHRDLQLLEQVEVENPLKNTGSAHDFLRSIKLERVDFCYPEASRDALHDITMEISVGESIGLIGPSGSGKTTLVDLLLGLLEPSRGSFTYNGQLMNGSRLVKWCSQVAYLPQQVFLIDNTIRHNVTLEFNRDEIDEVKLNKAIQQARLTDLVDQLPLGLDTVLGERGVRISGGQCQRIALARAFYHGRGILIMDEATSALDQETENEIVNEIQALKGRKTIIVIAHRLSTLRFCDRIYELKDGRIVNTGSYQKIISNRAKVV